MLFALLIYLSFFRGNKFTDLEFNEREIKYLKDYKRSSSAKSDLYLLSAEPILKTDLTVQEESLLE
jgi:hypothetical protein